jgi:hypothetical protein
MTNRFAGFADNGGVPFEKYTPAISRTAKPKSPTKPKSRLARNEPIDDEVGKPAEKGNNMTYDYDTSRGPWHAMIDRMARALQAQTGWSYAKSFTEIAILKIPRLLMDRSMMIWPRHLIQSMAPRTRW